jgi:branched-chain amino acid transport system ATP-binding protein
MIAATPPLLRLDAVTITHNNRLLSPLHLVVAAGARHGVISADPQAATALVAAVAGTTTICRGHIAVDGRPVTALPATRRAQLGIVAASHRTGFAGHLTVEQNMHLAVRHRTRRVRRTGQIDVPDRRVNRVNAALAQTGLTPHAHTRPAHLPTLQKRLLAVAVALVHRPRLLLIDNLAAGLDTAERDHLTAVLHRLPRALATLVAGPDATWIEAVTDTVTHLQPGPLTAAGPGSTAIPGPRRPAPAAAGIPAAGSLDAPLLTLANVTASTDTAAITDLHLTVAAGGVHAVLGAPGSGKTLLLNVIAGRHTPRASALICCDGANVATGDPGHADQHGISLATPDELASRRTVGEHLAHAERHHAPESAPRWTIPTVLGVFPQLNRLGSCYEHQLAAADRIMLGIGVALLSHPRLLLLDDPGRHLAARDRADLAAGLTTIARRGVTILLAESMPVLTPVVATRLSILHNGAIPLTTDDAATLARSAS